MPVTVTLTKKEFNMVKLAVANNHLILSSVRGTTKKEDNRVRKELTELNKLHRKLDAL